MRLTQLEYYIKTIECGSITGAAKALYISQPTLTKAISNLESEFSIQLLNRTSKGVQITSEGREFYLYAQEVMTACKNLVDTFGKGNVKPPNCLRVCSQQLDFVYDLVTQLYRLHHAPINIDLIETERSEVVNAVSQHRAGIGILVLSDDDAPSFRYEMDRRNLEVHELDQSAVYICMLPSSPLYEQEHITVEDASKQLHVVLDIDQETKREVYTQQLQHKNVDRDQLIFCNTVKACTHFMRELGAVLYSQKWLLGRLEDFGVRAVPVELTEGQPYPSLNRLVWIKRENEMLTDLEQSFLQLLQLMFPENPVV